MPSLGELSKKLLKDSGLSWTEDEIRLALEHREFDTNDYVHQQQPHIVMAAQASKPNKLKAPPKLVELHARLQQSKDKLFFIAHKIPSTTIT